MNESKFYLLNEYGACTKSMSAFFYVGMRSRMVAEYISIK